MGFALYPDPPIRALTVAAASTETTAFPSRSAAIAKFDPPYPQAMLVRVAMLDGAVSPRLMLAAGGGDQIEVSVDTAPVYRSPGTVDYVGDVWLAAAGGPVVDIVVGFVVPNPALVWRLGIQNTDTTARHFTVLVADSPADIAHPWVAPAPTFGVGAAIPTGQRPHGLAVDSETRTAFTANSIDNTVSLLDLGERAIIGTVPVGKQPEKIVVDPTTHTVYVANSRDATVSVIDPAQAKVLTTVTAIAQLSGLAVDPQKRTLYAGGGAAAGGGGAVGGAVNLIDTITHTKTRRIRVPSQPLDLTVNARTHTVYSADVGKGVSALDPATGNATQISLGRNAFGVVVDPVSGLLYTACYNDNLIAVVDPAAAQTIATVGTGVKPWRLAIDPDSYLVYVANRGDHVVTAIDTRTLVPVAIPVGPIPSDVAVDAATHSVLCAFAGDNTVSIIERLP
jgi:YVTN family beta-propeller protein